MNPERRDIVPPPELEDRTVATLISAQLIERAPASRSRAWQAAAAIAIFAAGLAVGRVAAPGRPAAPADSRYLLLLEGGPPAASAAEETATVAAYRAWAMKLREEGRAISGERLADVSIAVPTSTSSTSDLRGFFLISASNLEEAAAIARSCPHAQRGGRVVVRPIAPT
jgi:hypothetical protein